MTRQNRQRELARSSRSTGSRLRLPVSRESVIPESHSREKPSPPRARGSGEASSSAIPRLARPIQLGATPSPELVAASYVASNESVVGFGHGGSESLTIFLETEQRPKFVRKILSEALITPRWDSQGTDVMLAPCRKAMRQAEFLNALPPPLKPLFPAVLTSYDRDRVVVDGNVRRIYRELVYDMTYVPGVELSRFIARHRPPPKLVAILYAQIFRQLRQQVHAHRRRVPTHPTLEGSYFAKIESRLGLCRLTAPNTFSDALLAPEQIVINRKRLRNVRALLRCFRERAEYHEALEPRFHSLVVGDTNTENIKIGNEEPLLRRYTSLSFSSPPFTASDLELRYLDPRAIGFHEDGLDTGSDDPMYDNKPWHNSIGNYDRIHGEHFDLRYRGGAGGPNLDIAFHSENPYERSYARIGRYFAPAMNACWDLQNPNSDVRALDPYWLVRFVFVMGTHFMAMPPFHFAKGSNGSLIDTPEAQRRPLAIYAEGIKWLNLALDMLEGRVTRFLGCPVQLPRTLRAR